MNFLEGLSLLFIGLRLTGHIHWNWALILLPLITDWVIFSIGKEIKRQKIEEFIKWKLKQEAKDE